MIGRALTAGIVGRLLGAAILLILALAILHAYAGVIFFLCAGVAGWRLWRFANDPTGFHSGNAMTRSQLVDRLAAENPHLSRRDVERVVTTIFEQMSVTLEQGGRVELRGFGAFSIRARPARAGRNPKNGEPVQIAAKAVPFFKSGKELRQRLNAAGDA